MAVKTYDPKAQSIIVGSRPLTGFADELMTIEYNEDAYTLTVGSRGHGARAKNANKSARITLTLLATHEDNDYLMSLAAADELSGNGAVPFLHKDNRGTTLNSAATCWIVKVPAQAYNKEVGTRQWILETDELIAFVGGNAAGQ